jgi:hypothetical protein
VDWTIQLFHYIQDYVSKGTYFINNIPIFKALVGLKAHHLEYLLLFLPPKVEKVIGAFQQHQSF